MTNWPRGRGATFRREVVGTEGRDVTYHSEGDGTVEEVKNVLKDVSGERRCKTVFYRVVVVRYLF